MMQKLSLVALVWLGLSAGLLTAEAAVKEYDFAPVDPGQVVLRTPAFTPTTRFNPQEFGHFFLDDNGLGSVTANELTFGDDGALTVNFSFMSSPPGSYFYTRQRTTRTALMGGVGSGSTAPGGQVDWGLITGWSETGGTFCRSTPNFACTFIGLAEDGSLPAIDGDRILASTSYDLGTWTFDALGSFEATPYITDVFEAEFGTPLFPGLSNHSVVLRGRPIGVSLPALPVLGAGALGAAVLIAAARRLRGRSQRSS